MEEQNFLPKVVNWNQRNLLLVWPSKLKWEAMENLFNGPCNSSLVLVDCAVQTCTSRLFLFPLVLFNLFPWNYRFSVLQVSQFNFWLELRESSTFYFMIVLIWASRRSLSSEPDFDAKSWRPQLSIREKFQLLILIRRTLNNNGGAPSEFYFC